MRFICSGWGRARSATGWFYSASLGHRIQRTAFAKELKGHRERDAPLFRCNVNNNVGFDLGFLSAVGVRPREDARITDTMNLFTWFMGRRYKLVDAADHIGYEWTGRAHGSLADALATLAVQRWLEQWLVAE